jgi:hypothetical protein
LPKVLPYPAYPAALARDYFDNRLSVQLRSSSAV